jgi:hypothetical protein
MANLSVPTPPSYAEAIALLNATRRKLEDTERAHQLAEDKLKEQAAIMIDLLCATGRKETCSKCHRPAFWVRAFGSGPGILYNTDGTQHWPRCPQTARPPLEAIA